MFSDITASNASGAWQIDIGFNRGSNGNTSETNRVEFSIGSEVRNLQISQSVRQFYFYFSLAIAISTC